MEVRQVSAALPAMRNKTVKTDAKGIAQILRTGWFSPVHMKSREAHGLGALLGTRKALLKQMMDLAEEVRGLKIFGLAARAFKPLRRLQRLHSLSVRLLRHSSPKKVIKLNWM